ncbi:hypothetical protein ONS96_008539 [Cadophora gregata f. sp. sojae]|nr:hypothetical protein ONS96_008539 [Cadophora gregata f. sp. sojae]
MKFFASTLLLAVPVFLELSVQVSAFSIFRNEENDPVFNATFPTARYGAAAEKRATNSLRILSLGASIMSGVGSSTGNGCRKYLRDAFRQLSYEVDMVGGLHNGNMKDWEHEAVSGDVLTQILARVPRSVGFKPNVVIINGGTNDGNGGVDIGNVGNRMNDILNALWNAEDMSSTCIMLSTLLPTTNGNGAGNRGSINQQYRDLVTRRAGEGKCIYLADMDPGGQVWFNFQTDYMEGESPAVHPNDKGHRMMAAVFYQSIMKALSDGRVVAPGPFTVGPSTCDKFAGSGRDAGGWTQRGSGYDDGLYFHSSQEKGILWSATSSWDRDQWRFARLFNRNYDDLLAWISNSATEQVYAVWANSGDGAGKFNKASDMKPDLLCESAGLYFVDMNADGLDDLVCVDSAGNAYLSINQGDGNRAAGKSPTFKRVSSSALIMSNKGLGRARVRIADIDGDGRGDYCVTQDNGDILVWRNGGIGPAPGYWQALGKRFTGKGMGDVNDVRFEDINGDGRDDWMWVDTAGVTTTWINSRSCQKGVEGAGLNVAWRQAFLTGKTSGPTHLGMGAYLTDTETNLRGRIHFARIYGEVTKFGTLPKQDYIFMEHKAVSTTSHQFQMRVWKNIGAGGTNLKADGNKFCNMLGHSNGMMDYVWTYSGGQMELYANRGKGSIKDSDPDGFWLPSGVIWTPPSLMDRRDLHLADWDGDGDCDIIYTNPNGGAVQVWLNNYPTTKNWNSWTYLANPAPGVGCAEKRGVGIEDLAVRIADLTGNRRADYLCIGLDSRVTGFVQGDNGGFTNVGQIKVSIDKDRANMRFADVNGDGKADLLWIEKFSGDTFVWYNGGRADPAQTLGSSFSWRQQSGVAYAGLAAGGCLYYPDLDGNGRADEHYVLESFNNKAMTSLSPDCGLVDVTGDDASFDGSLPAVPTGCSTTTAAPNPPGETAAPGPTSLPDFPSRYLAGNPNCPRKQDFMAPLFTVGNADGGEEWCMGHWTRGVFPLLIEARATTNALAYIRIQYSDGSIEAHGEAVPDPDDKHRYGTITMDALVNTFSHFVLSGDGWDGGVGRLEAGITGKPADDIDAGKYYGDSSPPVLRYTRGLDGKGILLGFYGRSGDRIDMLQPYWTNSGLDKVVLTDEVFNPSFESLNKKPFEERGLQAVQDTYVLFNNRSSEDVTMTADIWLDVQTQTSINVGSENSSEFGWAIGAALKGEIKFNSGFPKIAEGSFGAELKGEWEKKYVDTVLKSKEDTETKNARARYTLSTIVKPGQKVRCDATAFQGRVNIGYTAKATVMFLDGTSFEYPARGTYVNAQYSAAYANCNDIPVDTSTDSRTITESGTYCYGRRIGGTGLTDAQLDQLCPFGSA